jgi:hypothetical protein
VYTVFIGSKIESCSLQEPLAFLYIHIYNTYGGHPQILSKFLFLLKPLYLLRNSFGLVLMCKRDLSSKHLYSTTTYKTTSSIRVAAVSDDHRFSFLGGLRSFGTQTYEDL